MPRRPSSPGPPAATPRGQARARSATGPAARPAGRPAPRPSGARTRSSGGVGSPTPPPDDPAASAEQRALEQSRRRSTLTGRAAILALVGCALLLSLAYPVRQFFDQRSQVSALRTKVAEQQQRVLDLQVQRKRWDDPAYVRAQARERLHYVLPGETSYVVVDGQPAAGTPGVPASVTGDGADAHKPAWYATVWRSVQGASASP